MKETFKKIKENKLLKVIGNILYVLLFVIVVLMLIVVILQRVSDNSISLGGYRLFTVATGSMEPKYLVGDILISQEIDPDEIQVGDDIVYKGNTGSFKDKIVTHQVVSIREENGEKKITTKGIANVTIRYGAAVTFGVLTTDSIEQAIERAGTKAGNKGFESMSSLIELINLYRKIGA